MLPPPWEPACLTLLAALLIGASPTPAGAQDIAGFPLDVLTGNYAAETRPVDGLAVTAIYVGDLQIFLEETPMAEVTAMLGGTLHDEGEAGGHMIWTCYTLTDGTLWVYSDGEMGEGDVTMLTLDREPAPGSAACTPLPLAASAVDLATLSLGDTAQALAVDYGAFTVDARGRVGFSAEQPLLDGSDAAISQWLVFRLRAGRIDAVGITQVTSD